METEHTYSTNNTKLRCAMDKLCAGCWRTCYVKRVCVKSARLSNLNAIVCVCDVQLGPPSLEIRTVMVIVSHVRHTHVDRFNLYFAYALAGGVRQCAWLTCAANYGGAGICARYMIRWLVGLLVACHTVFVLRLLGYLRPAECVFGLNYPHIELKKLVNHTTTTNQSHALRSGQVNARDVPHHKYYRTEFPENRHRFGQTTLRDASLLNSKVHSRHMPVCVCVFVALK